MSERFSERQEMVHKPAAAPAASRTTTLQRKAEGSLSQEPQAASASVRSALSAPGRAPDGATQAAVRPYFAHDFTRVPARAMPPPASAGPLSIAPSSGPAERQADEAARSPAAGERLPLDLASVRIHTGPQAAAAARSVGALAFTAGNEVVFGEGQYAPASAAGQKLLAHELAHVAQNQAQPDAAHLQRYEGPEHQDLGDVELENLFAELQTKEGEAWARQRGIDPAQLVRQIAQDPVRRNKTIRVRPGLELTPGQIISLMGDFYRTWKDFQAAPKAEIDQILAVMAKERTGYSGNADYQTITKGRYTELAKVNIQHFAPGNKAAWKDHHEQAIAKAKEAGKGKDEDLMQEAYFIDAAGGHFLTDSFASGHLLDSVRVESAIRQYLKDHPVQNENPEMSVVTAGLGAAGLTPSLVLKNIHDRMNAEGFEVSNAKGMKWKTFGDNHLKNAAETRRIAAYAVFVSRQQITRARAGETPDSGEVLDLLPDAESVRRATDQALGYIPQAVGELAPLIHRNIGMLSTVKLPWYAGGPVLPFVGQSILGTISDPGRKKVLEDYQRRKDLDPSTPYPTAPLIRFDFDLGGK